MTAIAVAGWISRWVGALGVLIVERMNFSFKSRFCIHSLWRVSWEV